MNIAKATISDMLKIGCLSWDDDEYGALHISSLCFASQT